MRVLFVRHAIAADKTGPRGSDMDRPLTDEGRARARDVFRRLAEIADRPSLILSSQAVRARETADILSLAFGNAPIRESALLNPGTDHHRFVELLAPLHGEHESIAVVGHEPDFSSILARVIGDGVARLEMKKAACAEVEVNRIGKGELLFLAPPRILAGRAD